ncbi:hypothetical protein EFK07_00115 [Pseudomonas putida]|uniref:Uncharacterized protein n=1 Tax=Pseudomonas putida TaxID=303 RepID=A0A3M8TSM3_PSEPU|nr:hypothetical protein EFK07_00115 [Pseudomonas putida]
MGGTPVAWIGILDTPQIPVGAGLPAKKAARWLAPASPVFAGEPAPTGVLHWPGRRARKSRRKSARCCCRAGTRQYALPHGHCVSMP